MFVVGAFQVIVALEVLGPGSGAGVTVEAAGGAVLGAEVDAEVGEEPDAGVELEAADVDDPSFFTGSGFSTAPVDADALDVLGEPSAPHPESDRIAAIAISAAVEEVPLQ